MYGQRTVTITIDEDTSEVSIDLEGYHGKGCAEVMQALQRGGDTLTETHKPEWNETMTTHNQNVKTVKQGR